MNVKIAESWNPLLEQEFKKPYFNQLIDFVSGEYSAKQIFPMEANIFRAFDACPFEQLKVVIIGQDPYHGAGQANGLCFSVAENVPIPPSLKNIFKEIQTSSEIPVPISGDLGRWASQGVLLLNSVLTVEANKAASHQGRGWETFTDAVVNAIADNKKGIVYMLWGAYAQKKGALVDPTKNCVLKSVHPSPLSAYRGFLGCNHFSLANQYLLEKGGQPIVW